MVTAHVVENTAAIEEEVFEPLVLFNIHPVHPVIGSMGIHSASDFGFMVDLAWMFTNLGYEVEWITDDEKYIW